MEKLTEYLETHSATDLARAVGMSRSQIWRLANGKAHPGADTAVKIEDATGGAVPMRSWARAGAA